MTSEFLRDAAMTGVIFGFFAMVWFGWAQEDPPHSWKRPLIAASALSGLTLIVSGLLSWKLWSAGTAFGPSTSASFGILVGIEFGLAGAGAGLLAWRRKAELIPVWIALVVGVHFFPLASLLHYPLYAVVAVLVSVVALLAWPVARRRSTAVSAVNGAGVGAVLLLAAIVSAVDAAARA